MFDIGFWELCLITVIALLVFGPEKLPEVARSAGQWAGRIRYFISTFKQDIDRELHLQEMRDSIKQSDQNGLHEFIEETKTDLNNLNKPINLDSDSKPADKKDSDSDIATTENISNLDTTKQTPSS